MGLYENVIARLRQETEKTGSVSELARRLQAQRATFHKVLRGDISTSAKTFCDWLERLGARVVFAQETPDPSEARPGDRTGRPATHGDTEVADLLAEKERLENALKDAALEYAKVQGMLCILERQNKEYQDIILKGRLADAAVGRCAPDAGGARDHKNRP